MRPVISSFCRVCGYDPGDPPWGADGVTPTFEICVCCGVEYGYQDTTPGAAARYRDSWLEAGGIWRDRKIAVDGLDTAARLSRVPEPFAGRRSSDGRPPVGTFGFVVGEPMRGLRVKVVDDYPGGIFVFWLSVDGSNEGWDNWFENWDEVEAFFRYQVGQVFWGAIRETD